MPCYKALDGLYQVRETIGSGGFAKVKLGLHVLTGEKVAIKVMDKNFLADEIPRVRMEIEAMKVLIHQNICKLYQVIETEDKFFMILEQCSAGELFDYIVTNDRIPEDEARLFFRQIISAVAYIHEQGFVHRDLKPENLLLDEVQNLKLIDFGLCTQPKGGMQSQLDTCCGSPAYAAPELIEGKQYVGSEADLWSMGVLLYVMLCGCLPFDGNNATFIYKKIQAGKYEVPDWVSNESADVIRKLLQVDPKCRATIKDLIEDPWVTEEFDDPLSCKSQHRYEVLDEDCLKLLSDFHAKPKDELRQLIAEWNYDYLTATYLLLLNRKAKGKPLRLGSHQITPGRTNQLNSEKPDDTGLSNGFYDPPYENLATVKMEVEQILSSSTDLTEKASNGICLDLHTGNPAEAKPRTRLESTEEMPFEKMEKEECMTVTSIVERECQESRTCPERHDGESDPSEDRDRDTERKSNEDRMKEKDCDLGHSEAGAARIVHENLDNRILLPDQMVGFPSLVEPSTWLSGSQEVGMDTCTAQRNQNDLAECTDRFSSLGIDQSTLTGLVMKKNQAEVDLNAKRCRSRCSDRSDKSRPIRAVMHAWRPSRDGCRRGQNWNGWQLPTSGHKVVHKRTCRKYVGDTELPKLPLWVSAEKVEPLLYKTVRLEDDLPERSIQFESHQQSVAEGAGCFKICCREGLFGMSKTTESIATRHGVKAADTQKSETRHRWSSGPQILCHSRQPTGTTSFCAAKSDRGKFMVPRTPRPRGSSPMCRSPPRMSLTMPHKKKALQTPPAMSALLHSMNNAIVGLSLRNQLNMALSPSRSFDSQLNHLGMGPHFRTPMEELISVSVDAELNQLHHKVEMLDVKQCKKSTAVGNVDRLLRILAPRKKTPQTEPRKVTNEHSIYITNYECANSVLNRLKAVLEEKSLPYQEAGFVLRSVLKDKNSKVQLAFDLEVVRLRKFSTVGIQRKKLKGDSWYYKRLCESILTAARF